MTGLTKFGVSALGRSTPLFYSRQDSPSTSAVRYYSLGTRDNAYAAEDNFTKCYFQVPGKLKNLYVILYDFAPGVGKSYTFTIRVNGNDTTLAVTIAGTDLEEEDTVHTATIKKGDYATLKVTPSGTPSACNFSWGMEFEPD